MIPVLSEEGIYVSHLTGHDAKTCGKVSSPCRTISYGIQQLSTGLYIYLDGTNTLENPYTCEPLDPGQPGIFLNKSVSFVGIKSRAHISCVHGNAWIANGMNHKDGIRISFSGLTFLNTSVRLSDAFVAVYDTVFSRTKSVSLDAQVKHLPRFYLSLNNVVFEQNTACIKMNMFFVNKVFVNITNTVFYKNGNPSSNIPSILQLFSFLTAINIELRNCSFMKNTFKEYGMIGVASNYGATNVLLKQLRLEENRKINPRTKVCTGLFRLQSTRLSLTLENGFIYKTSATLIFVSGQLAVISIASVEVVDFYSGSPGGGVVNVFRLSELKSWL